MKTENKENGNKSKQLLCGFTLNYLINYCKERLIMLEERKQTSITLGKINEMQFLILHLQQLVLDNKSTQLN
jgi:hypothetical protein